MSSPTYDALDKAWNSTCRVLFGKETAPLAKCADWLSEYGEKMLVEKSSLSGKPVSFSMSSYAPGASFLAFGEVDYSRKFEPFSINEMKDIDSIVEAVAERLSYTGNVVLGNSSGVEQSSNVVDSHFVLGSTVVSDSKYIAYSRYVKHSEYCFGLLGAEMDTHAVKCMGSEIKRSFECHMVEVISDCYYCAKVQNSRDCMFCFGVENKSHMIGNTPLPKSAYAELKAKLVGEIADEIKDGGRIFSLYKVIEECGGYQKDARLRFEMERDKPFDPAPIERAFGKTSSVLFRKEIGKLGDFDPYLNRHVPQNVVTKSALSGTKVINGGYRAHVLKLFDLRRRMATDEEMRGIGRAEGLVDPYKLRISASSLAENLHPIAYTNLDKVAGQAINLKDCAIIIDAQDCLWGSAYIHSKKCSHCFWTSSAEAVFGSCGAWDSSFCLKCYWSKRMQRAFECDGCESCADAYFLHNCENVRDSMFCFNAKNLTNAIGNAPMKPDEYKRIKSSLVSQIADELERTKSLRWDIFNIGAAKK